MIKPLFQFALQGGIYSTEFFPSIFLAKVSKAMTGKSAAAEKQRNMLKQKYSLSDETPVVAQGTGALFSICKPSCFYIKHMPTSSKVRYLESQAQLC